jgi:hypothetical protein
MSEEFARLTELTELEPPPWLDALVEQRMQLVLDAARQSSVGEAQSAHEIAAVSVPTVERWVYTVGLFAYGSQVLSVGARLFWRAVAG